MLALRNAAAAAFVLAVAVNVSAAELKSGIPVGGRIGTYSTTKVCGVKDGVPDGKSLCYT